MTELLAPAGDFACVEAAFKFGADAVYIGGPGLQLRADRVGFDLAGIKRTADYAHSLGKRVYVTVNCFAANDEIPTLESYGHSLVQAGADAVIVSDIGVLATLRRCVPELPIHISTQANCQNYAAANVYRDMGAERVVLGRELSLVDIRKLRQNTDPSLTLEAFVHGAMCMSYSGRCLLSSFMSGRSGNRGECTQPCRWNYCLTEEKRPGEYYPIEEYEGSAAILSSHDLCCYDILDEISAAGVSSFKIEGRMKSDYYVATVVNAYRMKLDGDISDADCARELDTVSHRPYSHGFYFGELRKGHFNDGQYHQSARFAGVVLEALAGKVLVQQRNSFSVGDTLELLSPGKTGQPFTVESITAQDGASQNSAHLVQQSIYLPCPYNAKKGDILRKRL